MHWLDRAKRALTGGGFWAGSGAKRATARLRKCRFEPLEPRLTLSGAPGLVPVGSPPEGTLSGKIVFSSAGHGWEYKSGTWTTDRPNLNGMIEPFGAQDQLTSYADYLLRAGATVVPMRPVGRQVNEVVLDNDSPGVTFSGSWLDNTVGPRWYDEDYGAGLDVVKYRFASINANETATATYTPNLPASGFYPVYTWVSHSPNRTNQLYKINHTGGQSQIRVDHRLVGNGWVYLGTYHFNAGSSVGEGSVVVSNQSTSGGAVAIADAIRFGNGMGDLPMGGSGGIGTGTTSGQPREDEASLLWVWRGIGQGIDTANTVGTNNVNGPLRMAAHMNASAYGNSVYIGIHSNAFNGAARGALSLVHSSSPTPNQSSLAMFTARQIDTDMRARAGQFEHSWASRSYTLAGSYGEITNTYAAGQFDATIVEVGFHDNLQDAELMRDPKGRDQMARSLYEGTLEYFRLVSSPQPANTTLPSAPTNLRLVSNASGQVTVSWSAGLSSSGGVSGVYGSPATGFRIYASTDGYGFDGGTFVSGGSSTSATLSGYDPTRPYYFQIAAVNAGGESSPSEVLTVLPSGGVKQILIVNGFDRIDRGSPQGGTYVPQNFQYTSLPPRSTGVSDRVWPRYNNSYDYVVQVHTAIHAARPGVHVASTSNEAVISGAVNLNDYHSVIWILGTEGGSSLAGSANINRTFDATEQTKVEQFVAGGGNLFVTGSDIAWDLDAKNNGRSFLQNTLKASYVADSAGTYTANVASGGIFAGLSSFAFSTGSAFSSLDGQLYNVNSADVITPQAGAVVALNYNNGAGAAAVQVQGTGGRGNVVLFGFPFEAMTNAIRRQQTMDRVLGFFGFTPAIELKTRVNGQDADSAPGPTLAAGSSATFTYLVTATGNLPVSSVAVVNNQGGANPTFSGGDTNGNGILDVGETWTYTTTRTVAAGQQNHLGSASGVYNGQNLSKNNSAHYFGSAPAVGVTTYVFGEDANSPPGPTLNTGSSVTFTYIVTNNGNIALSNVVVVDNNGTPGTGGDDFNPTLVGGDSNGNGFLDVGETWTFTATRTVLDGQYSAVGSATAKDSINQFVDASDPVHYFGVTPLPAHNADFNNNGVVDASDFVLWRKNEGLASGASQAHGDANEDGSVDEDDYAIWREQFGDSPGSSSAAAMPAALEVEPAALLTTGKKRNELEATRAAVFDSLAAQRGGVLERPALRPVLRHTLATAERIDWSALVAQLAERKVRTESPFDEAGLSVAEGDHAAGISAAHLPSARLWAASAFGGLRGVR